MCNNVRLVTSHDFLGTKINNIRNLSMTSISSSNSRAESNNPRPSVSNYAEINTTAPSVTNRFLKVNSRLTKEARIYRLKCRHIFHSKCLDSWRNIKNNCPLCRVELSWILNSNTTDFLNTFCCCSFSSLKTGSLVLRYQSFRGRSRRACIGVRVEWRGGDEGGEIGERCEGRKRFYNLYPDNYKNCIVANDR